MNVGSKPTEVILVPRVAAAVPKELAKRSNRVLRPRDAEKVYAHPRGEFARLSRSGVMKRLRTGYYALVPAARLGDQRWQPSLEAAALGIAQADYGPSAVALMGVSAARHHGALPRALALAAVAVPKQRPSLETAVGRVVFVKRNIERIDVERIDTDLTSGWVTTVEQTLLDIAARPKLGGLPPADVTDVVRALSRRADWDLLARLAHEQRRSGALQRASTMTGRTDA